MTVIYTSHTYSAVTSHLFAKTNGSTCNIPSYYLSFNVALFHVIIVGMYAINGISNVCDGMKRTLGKKKKRSKGESN